MSAKVPAGEAWSAGRREAPAPGAPRSRAMKSAGAAGAHGSFSEIVRWGGMTCLFALCLAVRPVVSFYAEGKLPMASPQLLGVAWFVNLLVALPVLPVVVLAGREPPAPGRSFTA